MGPFEEIGWRSSARMLEIEFDFSGEILIGAQMIRMLIIMLAKTRIMRFLFGTRIPLTVGLQAMYFVLWQKIYHQFNPLLTLRETEINRSETINLVEEISSESNVEVV